ncbi:tRNA epoxyqueuosine(34) reductase QueG [Anderseniella sp. Alg231-50]|uniref:tRNA epoxyqueuosine(34) reductase QueG n=1 Tax=Anderseniella sp. Alg231-50 TaxID=1922226 RepID=UPI000D55309F
MAPSIETQLRQRAGDLGFCELRITGSTLPAETGHRLREAVGDGFHAGMEWLETTLDRRSSPDAMWEGARSCIMLAMSYTPEVDVMARLQDRSTGVISTYALGRDYHDVIKGRLKTLAGWLAAQTAQDVKVFVDTAPLMEKPLAHRAGLGWQGKHTNLVSREHGSWFFLGAILSAAELTYDEAEVDHCGSCTSCLDVCPTRAFPAPYRLDAGRCISYLTIEHKGHIEPEFREAMGNRIYGCDDCLAVCPWNKFAGAAREAKLAAREDLVSPPLADLAALDDQGFRTLFSGSPVKRIGRDRFVRNVMIAVGNSGDVNLIPCAEKLLDDASAEVRAMAIWALSRLLSQGRFAQLAAARRNGEPDQDVRREWDV